MAIIKELLQALSLTDAERRQLRLAQVRTAEDLYSFLQAFPELSEGVDTPAVKREAAQATLGAWRKAARATLPTETTMRSAPRPTPGPLSAGDPTDRAMWQYLSKLDFAWSRLSPAFRAFAVTRTEVEHATGVQIPAGARIPDGTRLPTSIVNRPLRRQRAEPGHGWRLEVDVSLEGGTVKVDLGLQRPTGGRVPTPIAAEPGEPGEPWDDLVISIPPFSDAIHLDHPGWTVRDQGTRGTCTAFAVVASAEHHLGGAEDLSEEYLFDGTVGPAAAAADLARMDPAVRALCLESQFAYTLAPPPFPAAAFPDERRFRSKFIAMPTVSDVYAQLKKGRAPAVSLPVWRAATGGPNNWGTLVGQAYGHVLGPPAGAVLTGGHAVCIVGYEPDAQGGVFLFRNSWGPDWGVSTPPEGTPALPRPGYGFISAALVHNWAMELRAVSGLG